MATEHNRANVRLYFGGGMNDLCKICDTNHHEPQDHPFTKKVLTAEDIKNAVKHHHKCHIGGCGCQCGRSYDEKWNPIISRLGRNAPECKCTPTPLHPVPVPLPPRDPVRNAFLYGARFGYEHANSDHDLRRTLDEAEKWIYQFEKTEPAAVPSHVSPEPLSAEQIADEWEDCGSLACTILDVKLERVTFGPEGMTMDCETAKAIANTVIKRLRKDAAHWQPLPAPPTRSEEEK